MRRKNSRKKYRKNSRKNSRKKYRKKYIKNSRKKYRKKYRKNKKNHMKNVTRKKRKGRSKSYKIMKGGSMAGTFFRFLAGENDKDKLNLQELKELDAYKDERKQKQQIAINQSSQRDEQSLIKNNEEVVAEYKKESDIIDGISEQDAYNAMKGGGTDMENFKNWFNGSTIEYEKLVKNEDPDRKQDTNWERRTAGGHYFHVDSDPKL
jgi:vacuolar-type H+-ATPase catalytic subunit A/Vma1